MFVAEAGGVSGYRTTVISGAAVLVVAFAWALSSLGARPAPVELGPPIVVSTGGDRLLASRTQAPADVAASPNQTASSSGPSVTGAPAAPSTTALSVTIAPQGPIPPAPEAIPVSKPPVPPAGDDDDDDDGIDDGGIDDDSDNDGDDDPADDGDDDDN